MSKTKKELRLEHNGSATWPEYHLYLGDEFVAALDGGKKPSKKVLTTELNECLAAVREDIDRLKYELADRKLDARLYEAALLVLQDQGLPPVRKT
jgi:hypothetical protein